MKIRGQRVEPAEIEDVLCRVPGVAAAAVAVGSDGAGPVRPRLRRTASRRAQLHGRLRAALQRSLPTYMHPSRTLVIDRLPLLQGGKVDATALLALTATKPRREVPRRAHPDRHAARAPCSVMSVAPHARSVVARGRSRFRRGGRRLVAPSPSLSNWTNA